MDAASDAQPTHQCQFCSAEVSTDLKRCPECGAALILRETIGDLVIPGLTHVDPALSHHADDPLRIAGASASQSAAMPAVAAAAIVGGPAGLVALGGLAAIVATEYLSAGGGAAGRRAAREKIGEPSEVVLQMIEKLEREEAEAAAQAAREKAGPQEHEGQSPG